MTTPPNHPPPPGPPSGGNTGVIVGLAFAGFAIYSVVNVILGFLLFFGSFNEGRSNPVFAGVIAGVLALIGLGTGIGLLFVRKPWATGLGLGLMIGWALWSILSAGICTGLNPEFYR
ncbi:hypothetical protein [Nonomuraea sediminis]|uniref:hypothetical protein n=1 Tax=Nonomuraea sediminis TaxID=2835864 RepID=UPI001BDC7247|nr:hypothetical protein [Nonomuraea sediminis]